MLYSHVTSFISFYLENVVDANMYETRVIQTLLNADKEFQTSNKYTFQYQMRRSYVPLKKLKSSDCCFKLACIM